MATKSVPGGQLIPPSSPVVEEGANVATNPSARSPVVCPGLINDDDFAPVVPEDIHQFDRTILHTVFSTFVARPPVKAMLKQYGTKCILAAFQKWLNDNTTLPIEIYTCQPLGEQTDVTMSDGASEGGEASHSDYESMVEDDQDAASSQELRPGILSREDIEINSTAGEPESQRQEVDAIAPSPAGSIIHHNDNADIAHANVSTMEESGASVSSGTVMPSPRLNIYEDHPTPRNNLYAPSTLKRKRRGLNSNSRPAPASDVKLAQSGHRAAEKPAHA